MIDLFLLAPREFFGDLVFPAAVLIVVLIWIGLTILKKWGIDILGGLM